LAHGSFRVVASPPVLEAETQREREREREAKHKEVQVEEEWILLCGTE
jgi:hypothetical protein